MVSPIKYDLSRARVHNNEGGVMTVDMSRYRLAKDVQAAIDDLKAKIAELMAQVEELEAHLPLMRAAEVESRRRAMEIVKPKE